MTLAGPYIFQIAGVSRGGGVGTFAVVTTAATLFIVAGIAKITSPSAGGLDGLPRALGAAEVAFGCWLLSGIGRRAALLVCSALLGAFAAYHVLQSLNGSDAPCGCFGAANLSHELLAALCASASAACLLVASSQVSVRRRALLDFLVKPAFCIIAVWTLSRAAVQSAVAHPPRGWDHEAIQRLPEPQRSQLAHGSWRVVFVDPMCDTCQRFLAETEAAYVSGGNTSEQLLLVFVGRDREGGESVGFNVDSHLVRSDYMPRCLPAVIVLRDGILRQSNCHSGAVQSPPPSSS